MIIDQVDHGGVDLFQMDLLRKSLHNVALNLKNSSSSISDSSSNISSAPSADGKGADSFWELMYHEVKRSIAHLRHGDFSLDIPPPNIKIVFKRMHLDDKFWSLTIIGPRHSDPFLQEQQDELVEDLRRELKVAIIATQDVTVAVRGGPSLLEVKKDHRDRGYQLMPAIKEECDNGAGARQRSVQLKQALETKLEVNVLQLKSFAREERIFTYLHKTSIHKCSNLELLRVLGGQRNNARLDLTRSFSTESEVDHILRDLNSDQRRALNPDNLHQLQLIQGPPGKRMATTMKTLVATSRSLSLSLSLVASPLAFSLFLPPPPQELARRLSSPHSPSSLSLSSSPRASKRAFATW